ncbi:hydroxyacylglutathione mitochondrial-like isoform X1 [Brachionus plicatilis]|uniref:hydroxyacylglutathione hydrolase n=1 Tax=Brachionus plicatilis TaxID=10195 RepID=A0A3M7T788_BRAPC|nr:hydroxyacylglutathione mitochondrial-like isoform X1 [Brachionus plicatilis]
MNFLKLSKNFLFIVNPSKTTRYFSKMKIFPIEALSDNYMYLLVDEKSKECCAIDPVEPKKIIEQVEKLGLKLTKVLTTHHHWDHADGNPELLSKLPHPIPVYGGDDRIPALSKKIGDNDTISLSESLNIKCIFTPCHTTGHICYFVTNLNDPGQSPVVFTGDTLFLSGCGRFFEGNAEQMYQNLVAKLGKLPPETKVYCGHEYSVSNLKYALHVEADNKLAEKKLEWALKQREANLPTIPSTIEEELAFNPFMRVTNEKIQSKYKVNDPISCMAALRKEKDTWKPK